MIKFEELPTELADILKENGIKESDLYNHYSDLYVGCTSHNTACKIRNAGDWKAMSSTFIPQKGSDMDHYPIAVDIGLGYLNGYYYKRKKQVMYENESTY